MNQSFWTGSLFLILSFGHAALASALPPCLKATTSKNGNVLVVIEGQADPSGHISLQIFPKERWINAKDKLDAPTPYWTDFLQWSVQLDSAQFCPLPLVTDDGEFLVLVSRGPDFPDQEAFRIYRRRDHIGDPVREGPDRGVLIKSINFGNLLPNDSSNPTRFWTDHTPAWFVGSSLDFSANNRQLIFKHKQGPSSQSI